MGGSGGKKTKKPRVQHAPLLDFGQLMRQANESAAAASRAQVQAQIDAYPQLERLQLGTIQKIANNLNNRYTQDASSAVTQVLGIGRDLAANAGETNIERMLREQAESDLALGRSLNAAETRDAQQSARAAFAARGLGSSMSSSAAEILNRDAMAQAREASRRNFAAATNQMVTGNVTGRQGQAANVLGTAAGMSTAVDPYARALGSAGIGGQLGGNLMQSTGQAFSNAQQGVLGAATFNVNAIDSRNNAAMNNWASMEAARMQSGALGQQGMMGMAGGIGGGLLMGAGLAI